MNLLGIGIATGPYVAAGAAGVAINTGFSKLLGISEPKVIAVYTAGVITSCIAILSVLPESAKVGGLGLVCVGGRLCASHLVGKALANQICKVDVKAKDAVKLLAANLAMWGACALIITNSVDIIKPAPLRPYDPATLRPCDPSHRP